MEQAPDNFESDRQSIIDNSTPEVGRPVHRWHLDLHQRVSLEIAIVDDRPLFRECLARGLAAFDSNLKLIYLSNVDDLSASDSLNIRNIRIVLISASSPNGVEPMLSQISRIKDAAPSVSVMVLSETEDIQVIQKAFETGVNGYIPASISLDVAVRAIQLVASGGVYVPARILFGCSEAGVGLASGSKAQDKTENSFTSKQMAVMDALRRGKSNKTIASDLNMCESTVKVNVRTILKKLRAGNRTQAALILNGQINQR